LETDRSKRFDRSPGPVAERVPRLRYRAALCPSGASDDRQRYPPARRSDLLSPLARSFLSVIGLTAKRAFSGKMEAESVFSSALRLETVDPLLSRVRFPSPP
jgi:hypothetical protein